MHIKNYQLSFYFWWNAQNYLDVNYQKVFLNWYYGLCIKDIFGTGCNWKKDKLNKKKW
jgi:hypothetical protein